MHCAAPILIFAACATILWYVDLSPKRPKYDLKYPSNSTVPGSPGVFIGAKELEELMLSDVGVTILDGRKPYTFFERRTKPGADKIIPGSRNAFWKDFIVPGTKGDLLPVPEIEAKFRELGVSNDVPVVVYGAWTEGWGEEGRIFWQLDWLQHPQKYILYGGIFAWTNNRHKGTGRSGNGNFVARPADDRIAATDEIAHIIKSTPDSMLIIDARKKTEYDGSTPYGAVRGGHIPGAVSFEWHNAFLGDESGNLKPPAVIQKELVELGFKEGMEIATYCTGGVRSAFLYSVLRWSGYHKLENYAGSWWAWASRKDLPVSQTPAPSTLQPSL